MKPFYSPSPKEVLAVRKEIITQKAIPALLKNGFERSPYSTAWYGNSPGIGYAYDLCRLSAQGVLQQLSFLAIRGDRRIQVRLNCFQLSPALQHLQQLEGLDGLAFGLPPNSITDMQLRMDEYKGDWFFRSQHTLGRYFTKSGFERKVKRLGELLEADMTNIDHFIQTWNRLHQPIVTDWEGGKI